jgi:uncharacterized membrane protein YbhN (UPF0104 family)
VNAGAAASPHWHRFLPWLGALIGLAVLAWQLRRFDLDRFLTILAEADIRYVMLVPLAIAGEQLVRGWKWRQILYPLRPIGTLPLFGAIMAGYLLGLLIPFGFAALARSWLVARRESVPVSAVLATVALDRLTDGVVFALLVPVALLLVVFPDPTGGIRTGLVWGAAGSLVLFALLLLSLLACKRGASHPQGWLVLLIVRLPARVAEPVQRAAASFATGICWPREFGRGLGIVLASVAIKLIAATHLLWAGLAMGAELLPAQYLFVMVFLGFLVILGHFARIAGSFVIGGIFALGLFGVSEERALAMVLVVQGASLLSVAGIGTLALWQQGVALSDVRAARAANATTV